MSEGINDPYYHKNLRIQILDAYGKVMYTYVAHQKQMNRLIKIERWIKTAQIVLSAISAVGIVGTVITNATALKIISAIFACVTLGLNLYTKEFRLADDISRHRDTVDELWDVIQDYLSLLTDMQILSDDEIYKRRDVIKDRVNKIYHSAPRTDAKSYKEAQKAIQTDGEQFFEKGEIDRMLPRHLRGGDY